MTQTKRAIHSGLAALGLTVMVVEFLSQNRRSLQTMNTWQLARPHKGQEDAHLM